MVIRAFFLVACACLVSSVSAFAPAPIRQAIATLFENVRVFDGKSGTLSGSMNVLGPREHDREDLEGSHSRQFAAPAPGSVAGGGRTLDARADRHALARDAGAADAVPTLLTPDVGYAESAWPAPRPPTRSCAGSPPCATWAGPSFGLKRAIDEGLVVGPRIFPSGAIITVTSGHGDFRQPFELPRGLGGPQSRGEQVGGSHDRRQPGRGAPARARAAHAGASQIKLTAGGGVASPHSPLDASTFTEAELRAAVEAAENWGTYVTVHAYTPAVDPAGRSPPV